MAIIKRDPVLDPLTPADGTQDVNANLSVSGILIVTSGLDIGAGVEVDGDVIIDAPEETLTNNSFVDSFNLKFRGYRDSEVGAGITSTAEDWTIYNNLTGGGVVQPLNSQLIFSSDGYGEFMRLEARNHRLILEDSSTAMIRLRRSTSRLFDLWTSGTDAWMASLINLNIAHGANDSIRLYHDSTNDLESVISPVEFLRIRSLGTSPNSPRFESQVTDSATAVGYQFETQFNLFTAGSKLLQVTNSGVEKFYIGRTGDVIANRFFPGGSNSFGNLAYNSGTGDISVGRTNGGNIRLFVDQAVPTNNQGSLALSRDEMVMTFSPITGDINGLKIAAWGGWDTEPALAIYDNTHSSGAPVFTVDGSTGDVTMSGILTGGSSPFTIRSLAGAADTGFIFDIPADTTSGDHLQLVENGTASFKISSAGGITFGQTAGNVIRGTSGIVFEAHSNPSTINGNYSFIASGPSGRAFMDVDQGRWEFRSREADGATAVAFTLNANGGGSGLSTVGARILELQSGASEILSLKRISGSEWALSFPEIGAAGLRFPGSAIDDQQFIGRVGNNIIIKSASGLNVQNAAGSPGIITSSQILNDVYRSYSAIALQFRAETSLGATDTDTEFIGFHTRTSPIDVRAAKPFFSTGTHAVTANVSKQVLTSGEMADSRFIRQRASFHDGTTERWVDFNTRYAVNTVSATPETTVHFTVSGYNGLVTPTSTYTFDGPIEVNGDAVPSLTSDSILSADRFVVYDPVTDKLKQTNWRVLGASNNLLDFVGGGQIDFASNSPFEFISDKADGATAVGFKFTNNAELSTTGAVHTQFINDTTSIFEIDKDGNIYVAVDGTAGRGINWNTDDTESIRESAGTMYFRSTNGFEFRDMPGDTSLSGNINGATASFRVFKSNLGATVTLAADKTIGTASDTHYFQSNTSGDFTTKTPFYLTGDSINVNASDNALSVGLVADSRPLNFNGRYHDGVQNTIKATLTHRVTSNAPDSYLGFDIDGTELASLNNAGDLAVLGDVTISGTLFGGSPLSIGSDVAVSGVMTGPFGQTFDFVSEAPSAGGVMYEFDTLNLSNNSPLIHVRNQGSLRFQLGFNGGLLISDNGTNTASISVNGTTTTFNNNLSTGRWDWSTSGSQVFWITLGDKPFIFRNDKADGATATAFTLNANGSAGAGLSTAGAQILELQNAGTKKFSVDKDGGLSGSGSEIRINDGINFYDDGAIVRTGMAATNSQADLVFGTLGGIDGKITNASAWALGGNFTPLATLHVKYNGVNRVGARIEKPVGDPSDILQIGETNTGGSYFRISNTGDVTVTSGVFTSAGRVHDVTLVSNDHTATTSEYMLAVDSSGGPVKIDLPSAGVVGTTFEIKDRTGSAASNNITISGVSGETFDGSDTVTMSGNYDHIRVMADGADWMIV